ncbi:MAG TPA: sulfate ABC transporter substrate-binding protein [Oligoflexus sp.]|uniref:sulfate ABC transporter substrate-binding protein n=1 Tax=Oligoflexus sp. TaxID=1971216 RepID=UPI002D3F4F4F|nr:sulfate ABC transporter substrate-binding protein [Oligoflexus sp.]HYX37331.1 sulfate ABC transporter substrate-binding protein [Oligoflexus sp.]
MKSLHFLLPTAFLVVSSSSLFAGGSESQTPVQPEAQKILNVSYDPTRELFEQINPKFVEHFKKSQQLDISVDQSHGGSGKQAQAVVDGLQADVVTLALAPDVDLLVENQLVSEDWQQKLPFNSAPYTSTIVFVVRSGNPKAVADWSDLVRSDVGLVTPNPRTSGGARWSYLAAWGYALQSGEQADGEAAAKEFVRKLYDRVVALDSGARDATISFAEKNKGDVLITWENEAYQILESYPESKFEIVLPSVSILAEPVVAVVDRVVDARGTREAATAYLNYLYTEEAQDIIAQNHFRPRDEKILKKYEDSLKPISLFNLEQKFGSWADVQNAHFAEGGTLDQILDDVSRD